MAGTPKRAAGAEAALTGKNWDLGTVAVAMEALRGDFTPLADWRASSEYRRTVSANLLMKFFNETTVGDPQTRLVGQRRITHA
jgi:xanthine dehydrogenase small subunit